MPHFLGKTIITGFWAVRNFYTFSNQLWQPSKRHVFLALPGKDLSSSSFLGGGCMVAPFMGPRKIFPNTSHSLLSKLGCMGPVFYFSTLMTYGICQARISAWSFFLEMVFLQRKLLPKDWSVVIFRLKACENPLPCGWFERKGLCHTSHPEIGKVADRQKARIKQL